MFSSFYHKEMKYFHIQTLLRDIYIYLFSLVYVVYICWDFKVTLFESLFLVTLYPCYLAYSISSITKEDKNITIESENGNNISNIKRTLPWIK